MTQDNKTINLNIWLISSAFVLLQFFLQLSSGVVIGAIMQEMKLSPINAGFLGSSFYIVYTALQIPVGLLCDRKNLKLILTHSALLCAVGCLIFANSQHLPGLYLGRMLIGIGSSVAFVSLTHLVREHYPIHRFAILLGITETGSFLVTVLGIIGLGKMISHLGWRVLIDCAALIAIMVAYGCWKIIPSKVKQQQTTALSYTKELSVICANKKLWINGLMIGLSFTLVTVFGALWAVPFIELKCACSLRQASLITGLFFLGTGISCPLFGWFSNTIKQRRTMIACSYLTSALFLFITLYLPTQSMQVVGSLMFLTGLSCGAYLLAYPISNELVLKSQMSTAAGFTNTLALVTTPLLQPLIGLTLAILSTTGLYTLADYQLSLLILPGCLVLASTLVVFLPESPLHHDLEDKTQGALYYS